LINFKVQGVFGDFILGESFFLKKFLAKEKSLSNLGRNLMDFFSRGGDFQGNFFSLMKNPKFFQSQMMTITLRRELKIFCRYSNSVTILRNCRKEEFLKCMMKFSFPNFCRKKFLCVISVQKNLTPSELELIIFLGDRI